MNNFHFLSSIASFFLSCLLACFYSYKSAVISFLCVFITSWFILFFLTYSHLLFSGSFSRIFLYSPLSLLIYLFPTRHTYFPTPFHHFSDFLFYFLTYIPRFPSFFIFLMRFSYHPPFFPHSPFYSRL